MCLASGFGCARLLLAAVLGSLCVCERPHPVPRQSGPGSAVWVCVLGLRFRLRPTTPGWRVGVWVCLCAWSACTWRILAGMRGMAVYAGARVAFAPATAGWGVGVCVCLCARSCCAPPFHAGVCGVGVCAWARVSAAPCHCWLGCLIVFLFVGRLRLYPATPGWGVRCGWVCLCSGLGCAPPILAGVSRRVCVWV